MNLATYDILRTAEQITSRRFIMSDDYKVLTEILADMLIIKSTGTCSDINVNSTVERLIPFSNKVYTIINSMDYIAAEESVVKSFRGTNDLRVTSTIKMLVDNLLYFLVNDFKYLSNIEVFRAKLGIFLNTPLSTYGVGEFTPVKPKTSKIAATQK